jgi:hypothetical protein
MRQLNDDDSPTDLRRRPKRSSSFDDILTGTLIEIKQQQPLYYTVDRRAKHGQQNLTTFTGGRDPMHHRPRSAVPRSNRRDAEDMFGAPPPAPLRRSRRSRSAEFLLETDLKPVNRSHVSTTYLSAWDDRDLEVRPKSNLDFSRNRDFETRSSGYRAGSSADTVRSAQSVKSVTIAPKVTEFHYTGNLFIYFGLKVFIWG